MAESKPKAEDYPDLHAWAQAMKRWNDLTGVTSEDLVNQWNYERKQS